MRRSCRSSGARSSSSCTAESTRAPRASGRALSSPRTTTSGTSRGTTSAALSPSVSPRVCAVVTFSSSGMACASGGCGSFSTASRTARRSRTGRGRSSRRRGRSSASSGRPATSSFSSSRSTSTSRRSRPTSGSEGSRRPHERTLAGAPLGSVACPPGAPFKGLAAFDDSELDALFFFGREREREVLVANLLASRLTVLYGESGVGKSSLLAAGVVRSLRSQAPRAAVDLHATWSGGTDGVLEVVAEAEEGYLVLDQFEEYFLYHDEGGGLLRDLPELLQSTRVNVLIALREDSLARLDAFKAAIPSVFANQIRLEHLDRAAARSAILGPVDRWNRLTEEHVAVEPELVEAVLDQTGGTRIEAPYLQLVLERIWNAEGAGERRVLRRATLDRLGGAETIVREHLERALASLDAHEQEVAADMFAHLVTPSGTKIAHQTPDLAEYAGASEDDVRRVLRKLTSERIVHGVASSDRYEIFHDVLAEPIRTWQVERQVEAERDAAHRRQRRLYGVVAVALVALAVVAGLAVWAFVERGRAEDQARHARARELEARASENLTVDPNESVRLALAAAKREPGSATESVLRDAYLTDKMRLVRHAPAPVTAVAASPDEKLLAMAVARHGVELIDAHNRRLVRTVPVPGTISGLAFTDDGSRLISSVRTGRAHLWDVATAEPLPTHGFVAAQTPDLSFRLVA